MSSRQSLWIDRALVAFALALAGAVFLTRESITTTEIDARSDNVLGVWRQEQLTAVVLESPRALRLEKQTQGARGQAEWWMSGPGYPRASADAAAVDQLLNQLRLASWVRRLDPGAADPRALGLDEPRGVLVLAMGDIDYRLVLGKLAPAPSGGSYLAVSGEGVAEVVGIVKQSVADAILIDPREFLGRALVPYGKGDIVRLELSGSGGTRRLVRTGHRFRFSGMLADRLVDTDAIDPLFFHLARLTREGFLSLPEAEAALGRGERVDIQLWAGTAKAPISLSVGGRCQEQDKVVALRRAPEPLAGCVPETVMAGLTLSADALVDRTPFGFGADAVERVVTERGDRRLDLLRNEAGFALKSPVAAQVDLGQGNQRVEAIVNAKGEIVEKPDLPKLGLAPPLGRTTVTGLSSITDLAIDESVGLGQRDALGRLPLLRQADSVVLLIPPEAARAFDVDATLTRDLKLFTFADEDVSALHIRTERLEQTLVRVNADFQLEKPSGFEFDASLVSELLSSLRTLTADRWVSDSEDGSFGLEKPVAELTLTLARPSKSAEPPSKSAQPGTHTLTIGQSIPGGAYARLSTVPGVFVLSTQAVRAVTTPVLSRQAFSLDLDTLTAVDFETRERKVSLVARGGGWASDTPSVDARHAGHIAEAFAGLRPPFAWHIGKASAQEGFDAPTLVVRARGPGAFAATIWVGAPHTFAGVSGYFARISSVDATFALTEQSVRLLLDLL